MTNLLKRASTFGTNQKKAGNTGLALVAETVRHFSEHGDWRPMSRLLKGMDHTRSDQASLRWIMGQVLHNNIRVKKDVSHAELFVFSKKDNEGPVFTNKLAILDTLINDGFSFRSKDVREALSDVKEEKEFDLDKYITGVLKKLTKEHANLKQASAMFVMKTRETAPAHNPEEI